MDIIGDLQIIILLYCKFENYIAKHENVNQYSGIVFKFVGRKFEVHFTKF